MIGITKHVRGIKAMKLAGIALPVAMVLGACSTHQPTFPPLTERNKVTVSETIQRLELYAPASGLQLSARDNDAVGTFLAEYAQSGQGPLYVNVPATDANGLGVSQAKSMLGTRLASLGINPQSLQSGQYPSRPGQPAPVVVSYRRLATAPMDCSVGGDLVNTGNNQAFASFGCFQASNLAVLVDDPRQLLAPYTMDPTLAQKRTLTLQKYIDGEPTATPMPERQQVTVGE